MKSRSDLLTDPKRDGEMLLSTAQTLETLRVHWANVWRAYDGKVPDRLWRVKDKRKAQIELAMGMK